MVDGSVSWTVVVGLEVVGALLTALLLVTVLGWRGAIRRTETGVAAMRAELAALRGAVDRLAEAQSELAAEGLQAGRVGSQAGRPRATGIAPQGASPRRSRGPGGFTISI